MTGFVVTAILNSLWQAAAVTAIAWLGLKFLPGVNAATRYAVWWSVLVAILLLPVARVMELKKPISISRAAEQTRKTEVQVQRTVATPLTVNLMRYPTVTLRERPPLELHTGRWMRWLLATWLTIFLLRGAQVIRSYLHLRGIKHRSRPASREQRLAFNCWRISCGIDRPVELLISSETASPMAAGFLHPAVIVPAGLVDEFTEPEFDHVLLHELAHIVRHDDWTNLAARIADAAVGLHPVAAWILNRIDREREIACDDWVVAMTGEARPYAASLTRLFELCSAQRRSVLATGMADRGSQLGDRIEMLLQRGRNFVPRASLTRVAAGALLLLVLVLAGTRAPQWIAFAQDLPPAPKPAANKEPDTKASKRKDGTSPRYQRVVTPPQPPQAKHAPQNGSFLAALVAAGYGDLAVDEIIRLRNSGVSAEFLSEIGQSGWGKLTSQQLIELARNGVSADFLRGLKEAGLKDLSVPDALEMSRSGVRPEFLKEVHALGFGPYTAKQAIAFSNSGVRPELFRALKQYNFTNLDPRDIIELANNGVRDSDLSAAKEYGPSLTLKQIIRLKQAGVI